ncbi:helix-turn-helix domain-containing protein [Streptomyces sp. NPDC050658]|uniref:helix-turn-helix domain-containing protein n=1 Tax=unclassified Streptomyces TaxID=2593676 RepID=UPI00342E93DD
MDGAGGAQEFSAALRRLKQRSELSYQELARRAFLSRSTLHRYCSGKGVPGDYGVIARIAQECGAGPDELNHLLRCWRVATGEASADEGEARPGEAESRAGEGEAAARSAVAPALAGGGDTPVSPPGSASPARPPLARRSIALALAFVALVLATVVASGPPTGAVRPSQRPAQIASGTSWADAPTPVPRTGFGVTLNSSSGVMPAFRVGAVRLWDSETRWAQLAPRRGEYDWSTLDRMLDGAERQGLPALFVFGGTPSWAAPEARRAAYPDGSRAAPPDDLDDWDAFVRALVRHTHGRIEAYELWVMANHPDHFNGSAQTLVEMVRRASRIIRAHDRDAVVVCPSISRLWEPDAHAFLRRFAELGGYQHCDAAGIKLYQRSVQDPPETMLDAAQSVYRTFHRAGVHLPIWSTGTTQSLPLADPLDSRQGASHAARFYLTGLYARRFGVERMYFYAWGNSTLPIVLQAEGEPPTKAGLYVEGLQRWLAGAELRGCGHGPQISLPDNVWQCAFRLPEERGRQRTALIRWTHDGTARTRVGPGEVRARDLDGLERTVGPSGMLRITQVPVLISPR